MSEGFYKILGAAIATAAVWTIWALIKAFYVTVERWLDERERRAGRQEPPND